MPRMRTIDQTATYLRERDVGTALTKTAIRRLVITNAIPSVQIGKKYLINLDALEDYLSAPITPEIASRPTIRAVNEKRSGL